MMGGNFHGGKRLEYYHPGNIQDENTNLGRIMITRAAIATVVRPAITNQDRNMMINQILSEPVVTINVTYEQIDEL